jgi:hypothetical protein
LLSTKRDTHKLTEHKLSNKACHEVQRLLYLLALSLALSKYKDNFLYKTNKIETIFCLTMKIIERIELFISLSGISKNAFDEKIGTSNGYIGKQITRKASVGGDIIQKIVIAFPELSLQWLIMGDGQMLEKQPETDVILQEKYISAMERLAKAQEDNLDLIHQIHQLKTDLADCKNQKITDTKS